MVYTLQGCLHDIGVTLALKRLHPGSLSWLNICLHDTTMPAQVTPAKVHPNCCGRARISLPYEISQRYYVNAKRPYVAV